MAYLKCRGASPAFNNFYAPLIIVLTYILVGNTDRENYGTTLYPLHQNNSPTPKFLAISFADLNLGFGTTFPLLSDLQVFFPFFQMSSQLLGIFYLGWIFTFSILIVLSIDRVLSSQNSVVGKWKFVVQLLAVFNPACLDSLFFNDWPGTYFASQITFLVFINLTLLARKRDYKRGILLIYLSSCLIFLADPGYLAITLFGSLMVLLCTKTDLVRHARKKIQSFWFGAVILVSVIALSYFIEIWNQFWKFTNQNREYNNQIGLVESISTILKAGPIAYSPRTSTIYFQVFLMLVLVKLVFKHRRSESGVLYEVRSLLCILISLLLSLTPEVTFKHLLFAPTANFFFRELAFVFIIYLLSQKPIKNYVKRPDQLTTALAVYLLGSVLVAFVSMHNPAIPFKDKSWIHRAILSSDLSVIKSEFPTSNGGSVGISISEDAYSQIRNGAVNEIWMPTDLISADRRLISVVTKVQSKDFFNVSNSPFHASTVKNLDWCDSKIASRYWLDYVLLTESEFAKLRCKTISRVFGTLSILQVNKTPGSYKTIFTGPKQLKAQCNVKLSSNQDSLKVLISRCTGVEGFPIIMNLPVHSDSRLKVFGNNLGVNLLDGDGFAKVKVSNFIKGENLRITMDPSFHIKTRNISLWLLHSLLIISVFLKVLSRRKESLENR